MSINYELLNIARATLRRKEAFVDPMTASGGGDPAAAAAGGGAPPMDPSMGGAPPMDPSMMGGAPPADPAAAGGGAPPGPDIMGMLTQMQQQIQQLSQGGGAAGGGGAGAKPLTPKIDQNIATTQILKLLARLCDAQGISIPASEMVVTAPDLNQVAAQQQQQTAPQAGAVSPIQPLQPAFPPPGGGGGGGGEKSGSAFDGQGFSLMADRASALAEVLRRRVA